MKISHKEFARLLAVELGIDEKIANVHLLGLVSEINRVIESGATYTMAGFGSFSADDENRPLFVPDEAFAAEINFAFEGMPAVDVEAARSVTDDDMDDFFDESPPQPELRKTEELIIDEAVQDEDDPFGISSEPDDVITPRILEMMAQKAKLAGQSPTKKGENVASKSEAEQKETPSDDVFGLDDDLVEQGDEPHGVDATHEDELPDESHSQQGETLDLEELASAGPDPFEFLNELDQADRGSLLEDEPIGEDMDFDTPDSKIHDKGFDTLAVRHEDDKQVFDPFTDSADEDEIQQNFEVRKGTPVEDELASDADDRNDFQSDDLEDDLLMEIRTTDVVEMPSDDPFFIPEDSQTPAAVSEIAELHDDGETIVENVADEEVHKPTLSEDFKVGNIAGKKSKKDSSPEPDAKRRKREKSGNTQSGPVMWILLLAALFLVAFGVWWYMNLSDVQPVPMAGELPVAGLSQVMTDEVATGVSEEMEPISESASDDAVDGASSVAVDGASSIAAQSNDAQLPAIVDTPTETTGALASRPDTPAEISDAATRQPTETTTTQPEPTSTDEGVAQFGLVGDIQVFNQRVYGLVIHSLASQAEGNNICREIREQGIRCSVVRATTQAGRVTYRVALGQFESVVQAQQAVPELPVRYQRDNWVTRIN
jgi:cell division septation protein DedD